MSKPAGQRGIEAEPDTHRDLAFWTFILLALSTAAIAVFGLATGDLNDRASYWWLTTLAIGFAVLALTSNSDWRLSGIVGVALIVGNGAQLALTDPFWFQHIRIVPKMPIGLLLAACLILQPMIAAMVIWRKKLVGRSLSLVSQTGPIRLAALLVILAILSTSVTLQIAHNDFGSYVQQLAIRLAFLGIDLTTLVALVAAFPANRLSAFETRISQSFSDFALKTRIGTTSATQLLPWVLGVSVFLIGALTSTFAFENVPHIPEMLTYLFEGRYLADGMISVPTPPEKDAFDIYLMNDRNGAWFGTVYPGWPLMLGLAETAGLEMLITPILGGMSIVLLHYVVRNLIDLETAQIAAFFLAISPWFLMTSSSPMIHAFSAALFLGGWALLVGARSGPKIVSPFLAGALMGALFLARPLDGLIIGMCTGLALLPLLKDIRHFKTVAAYGFGTLAVALWAFPYHAALTGDILATPLNAYYDEIWGPGSNALGFGENRGAVPQWGAADLWRGHSPLEALINTHKNLHEINRSLFGWGSFSLLLPLIYFFWGRWTRFTIGLALISIVTMIAYSLYWFYGGYFMGARYWFLTLIPLIVFSVLGLKTCVEGLNRLWPGQAWRSRLGLSLAHLAIVSTLVYFSWVAINRYPEHRDFHADYKKIAIDQTFENALVFITIQDDVNDSSEYGSAYWLNDFHPDATTPIFARNLGKESVLNISKHWPEKSIFFVQSRSAADQHVTVTLGPVHHNDLLEMDAVWSD